MTTATTTTANEAAAATTNAAAAETDSTSASTALPIGSLIGGTPVAKAPTAKGTKAVTIQLPEVVHDYFAKCAEVDERSNAQYLARELVKVYRAETTGN